MKQLVANPNKKAIMIAQELKTPLSTIQRRKAKIDRSVLRKQFHIDIPRVVAKTGDILVDVNNGNSKKTAEKIALKFKRNVMSCTTRINSSHTISIQVMYVDAVELHKLLEEIKALPDVVQGSVTWSEVVEVVHDKTELVKMGFYALSAPTPLISQ